MSATEHRQAMRANAHARIVEAMRQGRRERASVIPARRGRGSYRRRDKYGRQEGREG